MRPMYGDVMCILARWPGTLPLELSYGDVSAGVRCTGTSSPSRPGSVRNTGHEPLGENLYKTVRLLARHTTDLTDRTKSTGNISRVLRALQ